MSLPAVTLALDAVGMLDVAQGLRREFERLAELSPSMPPWRPAPVQLRLDVAAGPGLRVGDTVTTTGGEAGGTVSGTFVVRSVDVQTVSDTTALSWPGMVPDGPGLTMAELDAVRERIWADSQRRAVDGPVLLPGVRTTGARLRELLAREMAAPPSAETRAWADALSRLPDPEPAAVWVEPARQRTVRVRQ